MPVLLNPLWRYPADYRVDRAKMDFVGFQGLPSVLIEYGRYTVIEEIVLGGFRYHIRFKEHFWEWNSSFWPLEEIFEDFYVTYPGGTDPIEPGSQTGVGAGFVPPYTRPGVFLDQIYFADYRIWFWQLPTPTGDYWNKNGTPIPAMPFFTDG